MSIVSVLQVEEWKNVKQNLVVTCFDSRVNTCFFKGGKEIRTEFDGAQKVLYIGHNIIIGSVNEFMIMGVVSDLKEKIESRGYNQNSIQHNLSLIKDFILSHIPSDIEESDLFIVIKAHSDSIIKVYKLVVPSGICVELKNDSGYRIDSIGSSAEARNEIIKQFENDEMNKWIDNVSMDYIQKLTMFFSLAVRSVGSIDEDVGGDFNNLVMRESGWLNIGLATSTNNGERWFANALGSTGFELQINGRKHRELSSDPIVVERELQKKGSR